MKLQDLLDRINQLSEEDVIFARKPWALDVEADVGALDENFCAPGSIESRGLEYFLEVSVAKEVLAAFENRNPTVEQVRALLLFYAENDAYPKCLYE